MNIDWSEAPYWANWVAMDDSGGWWWHEFKPNFYELEGEWYSGGKSEWIGLPKNTLVQRPREETK